MAARRRASLTHALPHDMAVEIAGHVAATSPRPVDDLCSLRATCRAIRAACGDRAVGRRVALEREGAMRWSDNERYLAVVGGLSGAGNPEACFLSGLTLVFTHRCARPGSDLLARAAVAGHKVAAYVLALVRYRADGGASDVAKQHIRQVEGEPAADVVIGGCKTTPKQRSNKECVRCRTQAVEAVRQATWKMAELPAPTVAAAESPEDDGKRCTVSGCGVPEAWCDWAAFCSEDCRIRHECTRFFSQLPLTIANFVT
ncbi:hypothetical protein BAE44_0019790 [Dichanthelium oligosanthes]|uniref:At2g35280-like TPR domain-containing protein n=1 Tax=Dichanthelium oligosanthes TaxID=888268 RepID=A0A1E5V254_9POAL|nr:hypothetical protein BAE44_0019790 [Dichanthelium oligosanthes]